MSSSPTPRGSSAAEGQSRQRRPGSPSPGRGNDGRSFFPNSDFSRAPGLSPSLPGRGSSAGGDKENISNSSQLSSSRGRVGKSSGDRSRGMRESRQQGQENVSVNSHKEPQRTYTISVPAGIRPGMQFAVDVEGKRMAVTCPANVEAGMNLQILQPETQAPPSLPVGGGALLDRALMSDNDSDSRYREAIVDLLSIGQLADYLSSSEDANARELAKGHLQDLVAKSAKYLGAQRSKEARRRDRDHFHEAGSAAEQAREKCMELYSAIAETAPSQLEPQPPGPLPGVQMHLAGPAPPAGPAPAGPAILPQGIAQFLAGAVEDFSSSDDDESSAGSLQLTNFVASMETVKKNGSLVRNEDYFGFMEEAQSNSNAHNLLARVEQKCGTALEDSPTDTILVVGKCDPMSRFIQQFHRLLANEIGLSDLEEKISLLAKTLNPHMKVIAAAQGVALDDAKAAVEKRHRHASLDMPVSSLMEIMDPDADAAESSSKEPSDLQLAAKNAAKEYGGGAWKDLATLTAYGQVFLAWTSSLVVFIRVLRQVTYKKFLELLGEATALKVGKLMVHFRGVRDLDLSDGRTTMADVYEKIIIPSMHPDESEVTREKADGLLAKIKFLGHKKFAEYWKVAGAMSLTKTFSEYSEDAIPELLEDFDETYYSESDDRRRISSRTATYPLTAKRVASALSLHGMSEEDAYWLPFALTCCPLTMYNNSPLAFLHDPRLLGKVTDEAYAKKTLTRKKGGVRAVFDSMKRALIGFNKLHVYIDVTADVRNGTSNAHQALAAALSLPPPSE